MSVMLRLLGGKRQHRLADPKAIAEPGECPGTMAGKPRLRLVPRANESESGWKTAVDPRQAAPGLRSSGLLYVAKG
jgi:hypothetical protein